MSAEEVADVTVLRARVKHMEMQQGLMDGELESMSSLAKETDTQLRSFDIQSPLSVKAFASTASPLAWPSQLTNPAWVHWLPACQC